MKVAKQRNQKTLELYRLRTARKSLQGYVVYLTPKTRSIRTILKAARYTMMYSAGPQTFLDKFRGLSYTHAIFDDLK